MDRGLSNDLQSSVLLQIVHAAQLAKDFRVFGGRMSLQCKCISKRAAGLLSNWEQCIQQLEEGIFFFYHFIGALYIFFQYARSFLLIKYSMSVIGHNFFFFLKMKTHRGSIKGEYSNKRRESSVMANYIPLNLAAI
jgi:hypothetical protein